MVLHFVDCKILINGCYLDRYDIEEGERIDFLCLTNGFTPFESYISYNDSNLISTDFDILTDDSETFLFIKKQNIEFRIYLQHTFAFDMISGVATVYRDGGIYITFDSNGGYNIFELPYKSNTFSISTNNYGDILYLTYFVDNNKKLSVYSLRSFTHIQTFSADVIEIDDNTVTLAIERKDILLRKSTLVYEIRNEKCNKISNSFECTDVHVCTDALIPVLFLEGAISGDFSRIEREYLSNELVDDTEGIMSLFEGITGFIPLEYRENIFIVEFTDKKRLFEFICQDSKVVDILTD